MSVVIFWFFVAAIRYVLQHGADWWQPFYDPATFSIPALSKGTSLAVLTYIGFDGIATLSEEAENPRRNILLATVFTCLLTGVLRPRKSISASLYGPTTRTYPDAETAFVHVAGTRRWAVAVSCHQPDDSGGDDRLGAWERNWPARGCYTEWAATA